MYMAPKAARRRSSMGTLSEEKRNTLEAAATAAASNTAANDENDEVEMSDEQKEEELRRVQTISTAFHGFDEDDIRALATSIQVVAFKRGEDILRKGESASWFGIVLQGTLDVLVNVGAGLIFHIQRGDVFGERMLPLIRTQTAAVALTPAESNDPKGSDPRVPHRVDV